MVDLRSDKKLPSIGMEFDAVVGQRALKEALLTVAADDGLSGLLIRGEKGTAKSTAVRGLADLLPRQRTVADCPFGCPPGDPEGQCTDCRDREDPPIERRSVPLVTLPLGATRERVVGSLSVADALAGDPEFDPGLLARANRGILYVDEVNLLEDHLVDALLDAAASGVNRVERDGVSLTHPAEFTLIGTMNPEEGDLRPQLRDRFALRVGVEGSANLDERVAIIDRALGASGECNESVDPDDGSRERLLAARGRLADVDLPTERKRGIAELCRDAGVEGHRADIATARAARTLAALDGRERVLEADVRRAAELALPHRLQSRPFEDAPDPEEVLDDHFDDGSEGEGERQDGDGEVDEPTGEEGEEELRNDGDRTDDGGDEESGGRDGGSRDETGHGGEGGSGEADPTDGGDGPSGDGGEDSPADEADDSEEAVPLLPGQSIADVGEATAPSIDPEADADGSTGSPAGAATVAGEGSRVRTERAGPNDAIDAAASVRAAAGRGADGMESRDLRRSVRTGGGSALVVFALDASASMRGPMRAAKAVVMELLRNAYEDRDEVSVVAFAGEDGEVLLPPTDSVSMAARHLKELPTADRTPLTAGLQTAGEVLARADPTVGVVVLVTDGRANAGDSPTAETRRVARDLADLDAHLVVVDAGAPDDRTALLGEIVRATDGERVPLSALSAEAVERAVASARDDP